ncbi:MAG: hypothetical protein P1P65_03930 [Treponema sp.]
MLNTLCKPGVFFVKYAVLLIMAGSLCVHGYAEESGTEGDNSSASYQITAVTYSIKGMTRQYPLSRAVPIDKTRLFHSAEELELYIDELKQKFTNIRVIQSVEIQADYQEAGNENIIPVTLSISVTDTWNFIAVPYPSFDSNSGFELKIKMQDFNFVGTLQPLKADIVYRSTETNESHFSSALRFSLPFSAKMFDMLWNTNFELLYAYKAAPEIRLGSGLEASYKAHKHVTVAFGIAPELVINDHSAEPITDSVLPKKESGEYTGTDRRDLLGYLYPHDRYYFKTTFFTYMPILITEVNHFGALVWTPGANIGGNWAFDGIQANKLKAWSLKWEHSLSLSQVNWIGNFRKGLSFSLGNSYSYQFYKDKKMNISFDTAVSGYYPFVDRVGIYGRMQFFYNLFNTTTAKAGIAMRGILNKRIHTDTAFSFNLDIPIRIATLDFERITGIEWTRVFNCDIHFSPFLDIAVTHDKKTGRYYHPADGWYAGGLEVIVYPQKMRSIYVRASAGFDLAELKNVPGINKIRGRAKRDGESITEIFIGIGVHY